MIRSKVDEGAADDDPKISAFTEEAIPHMNDLYAKAIQYTKDEKSAEDLVQETLVKAYDNWDRFEIGTNCQAWLFTILRNTFINQHRKQKREREVTSEDVSIEKNFFDRENSFHHRSPEKGVLDKTFSEEMKASLKSLPVKFRQAVLLADLNDFSYKEIAYILDCPMGTVMSRIFRGRKMVRQKLAETAYERGIIKDTEPFEKDETNRTRKKKRDR
ncbi:MAG: sigma-70 family RNA polymerase sigma factor [Candidatus Magasanikbacteria bacterium]